MYATDPTALFASQITRYELRFGAAIHAKPAEVWGRVERDIVPLAVWLSIDDDLVLVTRNARHFEDVPDITIEDWFREE